MPAARGRGRGAQIGMAEWGGGGSWHVVAVAAWLCAVQGLAAEVMRGH